jgi:hypothetical protein
MDDQIYIDDAIQAIRSDEASLNYVLQKESSVPWAFNSHVSSLGISKRMKLINEHSGSSLACCLRMAEQTIKKNGS